MMSDDGWGIEAAPAQAAPAPAPMTAFNNAAGDSTPAAAPRSGFGVNAAASKFSPATSATGFAPAAPASGAGFPAPGGFPKPAASAGGFGQGAPAAAPTGGFGQSAPAAAPIGGFRQSAAAPTGGFGQGAAASVTPGGFGNNANQGFGAPAPASNGFNTTPAPGGFPKAPASASAGGFGQGAPAAAPATTGGFGGANQGFNAAAPAVFNSTPAPAPGGFPKAPATASAGGFGGAAGSGGFGGAAGSGGFGGATCSGGFGSAAGSGGFGGAAPAAGGTAGGFGGAATGGFGGAAPGGFGGAASGGFGAADGGFNGSAPRGNDGTCFNCHQPGHKSNECTEPRKPREGGDRPSGCFNCGNEGHRKDECTEPPKAREDGAKPASTFIPTEESPEELLHAGVEKGVMFERFFDASVTTLRGGLEGNKQEAAAVFELGEKIFQNVVASGYTKPTPVQKHAMPAILAGNDILACAQTGSGKTAAFVLPIMSKLLADGDLSNAGELACMPRCLIVSPTRELAVQIYNECRKFSHGTILSCKVAYGGTHVGHQRSELSKGASIVVGTTGRLNQFIQDGTICLEKIRFFVLDEADRMLDMGFGDDINRMHQVMPDKKTRQTLMFSATFPTEVQNQARQLLKDDYVMITIDAIGAANKCITQELIICERNEKKDKLLELLSIDKTKYTVDGGSDIFKKKTLIFVSKKSFADTLGAIVSTAGVPATTMHGDRMQNERAEAMRDFVSGRKAVMIATAVAERGLDIKGVDHVINYDLPDEIDQYVHRIGRTGRVGNSGRATSFYIPAQDNKIASGLLKCMEDAGQVVPEWLTTEAQGGSAPMGGGFSAGGFGAAPAGDEEAW